MLKCCIGMILQDDGHCGRFQCNEFHLQRSKAVYFRLTAKAALHNLKDFQSVSDGCFAYTQM